MIASSFIDRLVWAVKSACFVLRGEELWVASMGGARTDHCLLYDTCLDYGPAFRQQAGCWSAIWLCELSISSRTRESNVVSCSKFHTKLMALPMRLSIVILSGSHKKPKIPTLH